MANEGYEKAYRDALEILYLRGKKVGKPARSQDGLRYRQIDHVPLGDREILIEAWGESLADEIIREQHDGRRCRECDRLWGRYADMLKRYLSIFHGRSGSETGFDPLVRRAVDIRNRARQAVLDHTSTHQLY